MYRDDVPRRQPQAPTSPNAEPELLTWHEVIAQRSHVELGRFHWDQRTRRLWYAALTVDGVAVELLMRMKTTSGWPGFIIAADLCEHIDHTRAFRVQFAAPFATRRFKSLCYKPRVPDVTTPVRPPGDAPPRWLALTTGTVGPQLLDEIDHIIKVVRAGEFEYVVHTDIHAVKADATLQSTINQWSTSLATIAPRLT